MASRLVSKGIALEKKQKCPFCKKAFEGKWRGNLCYHCSIKTLNEESARLKKVLARMYKKRLEREEKK